MYTLIYNFKVFSYYTNFYIKRLYYVNIEPLGI